MDLILFDLGGTLIDDPFADVLRKLREECLANPSSFYLEREDVPELFGNWRKLNYESDFAYASHFMQEESWLASSLLLLNRSRGVPELINLPLASLTLLKRYRELAQVQIRSQPCLPVLRKTFVQLKRKGIVTGVASNDREYAAKAMLAYAGIIDYFDSVLTSEQLSKKFKGAQKPKSEFFHAVLSEIKKPASRWRNKIYVGDSERNDILPAKAAGFKTIRIFNKLNPRNVVWIDNTKTTVADYQCSDRRRLLGIIETILGSK